jgi:outer membrane protein insertion porin family/translocation and assembly module TamA
MGFLFASNYGDYVQHYLYPPLSPNGASNDRLDRAVDRDIEIVYFRGFFSGGPSSNRGYPLRGIAPHGVVPFLSPVTLQAQQQASNHSFSCIPGAPNYDATDCSIPIGGFTLWEASAEVRFDVSGPLGVALFCDMGDVAPGEMQLRFDYLHLSCGSGARYGTPVGAIRLDIAYRIPGMQVLSQMTPSQAAVEGTQPLFLTLPLALAFGIGETF